jgi:RNA polymerase sigma-32 factor
MATSIAAGAGLIRQAMAAPFLARDEERALAVRWRECSDQAALHRLTQSHMRLVVAIANRFRRYGLPSNDLIQEGYVGLLEAAARFEPEREVRFSTYATWWIRAQVQDYVLRNWSIVRGGTSSSQKSLFFNLRRMRARLTAGGETLPAAELHQTLAATFGVSTADVARMDAHLAAPDLSLNAPLSVEDGASPERVDLIVDEAALPDEATEGVIDAERRRRWLAAGLATLNERERNILIDRRLAEEAATLEELGTRHGISKERVRQIEHRALEKLRDALARAPEAPM